MILETVAQQEDWKSGRRVGGDSKWGTRKRLKSKMFWGSGGERGS